MPQRKALFIFEPDSDPIYNMASDSALFALFAGQMTDYAAILRLYTWAVPAITIGYNQDIAKVLDPVGIEAGMPVIRRITGGRAIYHDCSEITFSLTAGMDKLPIGIKSLTEINTAISVALVEILNAVGIKAEWRRHSDDGFRTAGTGITGACFASVSRYEIVSQGVKVAGGAQRRNVNCFIHQGSIKVNGIAFHPALGPVPVDHRRDDTNNPKILISDMKEIFVQKFADRFGFNFDDENRSSEIRAVIELETEKLRRDPLQKKINV